MGIASLGSIIVIISISVVKIIDIIIKKISSKEKKDNITEDINLLSLTVSYPQFDKVAREALRPNGPKRNQEEFLDFFVEHIQTEPNQLVNNLLSVNYGDDDETY